MDSALQTAVYTALTANTPLMAAVTGIYDGAPQSGDSQDPALMPYVTFDDDDAGAWATDDWSGGEVIVNLSVWSRYQGRKEAKDILGLIRSALDRATLSVAGYNFVTCDYQSSGVILDADGETRHGLIAFRVLLSV